MNPPARDRASQLPVIAQAAFFVSAALWLGAELSGLAHTSFLSGLVLVTALATTVISLAQSLPAQNVVAVAALVAFMASLVEIINAKSGIPLGSRVFTDACGPRLFGLLPWPMPLLWVTVILNSRGVARLILRPWRKIGKYGLWVIGLTAVLTMVLEINLEPFAAGTGRFWIWSMSSSLPAWHTAPLTNFSGWLVVTVLVLAFTTPWLINKSAARSSRPDYRPLAVWITLNLLLVAASAMEHFWSAVIVGVVLTSLASVFAIRGGRW